MIGVGFFGGCDSMELLYVGRIECVDVLCRVRLMCKYLGRITKIQSRRL